jgi:hypothetical protein
MADSEISNELIHLLLARLERISADSYWAHRASGIRGALIKIAENIESRQPFEIRELRQLTQSGFLILELSVKEKRPNRKIKFK